jgi:hypothetical protein
LLLSVTAIARRLPLIVCAQVFSQVNVDEHPALPWLGARHFSGLSFAQQGDGVDVEKGRGFPQVEGFHVADFR